MTKITPEKLNWANPDVKKKKLYKDAKKVSEGLLEFIKNSPTAWQSVAVAKEDLDKAGFVEYNPADKLELKSGDKGYFVQNGSAIIAFLIGEEPLENGFRIFGSHSDSPALKVKPNSVSNSEGISRLTVEVYGGPLLNTWFDRPLSLAGRVVLRGKSVLEVEEVLIDFKEPILILPNLAIHMGNTSNDGLKIERQKDILPFLCLASEDEEENNENIFENLIAKELSCKVEDILDFELLTYEVNPPSFCGLNDCFISSGRLDNLAMFKAGLDAIIAQSKSKELGTGIKILLISDNEEVGSMTKQGADSLFVRDLLERITIGLGGSREDFLQLFPRSFMMSADLAHACHPNYPEIADPGHRPRVNAGPVIKVAASQSYASDAISSSIFKQLANEAKVPYQVFVNRSDKRGGSTIGPITASLLPMNTVDCGNAIWGMHSIRETGGILDQYYMTKLVEQLFAQ